MPHTITTKKTRMKKTGNNRPLAFANGQSKNKLAIHVINPVT